MNNTFKGSSNSDVYQSTAISVFDATTLWTTLSISNEPSVSATFLDLNQEVSLSHLTLNQTSNVSSAQGNQSTEQWVDILTRMEIRIIFSILYIFIFTFGLFGNTLIIYVVCKNKNLRRTVTNIFIANLAVSDIMMSVLCVPFTPVYSFIGSWVFGRVLCRMVSMTQCMSVYLSTLTLTVIAYDRYRVILYPFKPRMSFRGSIYRICIIWLISALISLPLAWFQKVVEYPEDHTQYCEEFWPSPKLRIAYSTFNVVTQFIFPLVGIAYFYHCVSAVMSAKAKKQLHGFKKKSERNDIKRKKKLNIMLITMITLFSLCWLPLNFVIIFFDIYNDLIWWKYYTLVFFTSHLIAMSSTCHNPILYAWFNSNFRQEFKIILPCFKNSLGTDINNPAVAKARPSMTVPPDLMTNFVRDDDDNYDGTERLVVRNNDFFESSHNRASNDTTLIRNSTTKNGSLMGGILKSYKVEKPRYSGLSTCDDANRIMYAPIKDGLKRYNSVRFSSHINGIHTFDTITNETQPLPIKTRKSDPLSSHPATPASKSRKSWFSHFKFWNGGHHRPKHNFFFRSLDGRFSEVKYAASSTRCLPTINLLPDSDVVVEKESFEKGGIDLTPKSSTLERKASLREERQVPPHIVNRRCNSVDSLFRVDKNASPHQESEDGVSVKILVHSLPNSTDPYVSKENEKVAHGDITEPSHKSKSVNHYRTSLDDIKKMVKIDHKIKIHKSSSKPHKQGHNSMGEGRGNEELSLLSTHGSPQTLTDDSSSQVTNRHFSITNEPNTARYDESPKVQNGSDETADLSRAQKMSKQGFSEKGGLKDTRRPTTLKNKHSLCLGEIFPLLSIESNQNNNDKGIGKNIEGNNKNMYYRKYIKGISRNTEEMSPKDFNNFNIYQI